MTDLVIDDLPDHVLNKLGSLAAKNNRTVEDEAIAMITEALARDGRQVKPKIKLWGRLSSINVQKVVWALDELGLAYERVDAGGAFGITDTAAYGAMNPNRKVPTIDDEGFVLWESNAIVRYLAAKYGPGDIWPDDPRQRADADRWMDWQATEFTPPMRNAFWHLIRKPPEERDAALIAESTAQTEAMADILDAHLAEHAYVAGSVFTAGDIPAGAAAHRWLNMPVARKPRPHLEHWYEGLAARPGAARALTLPIV